MCLLLREIRRCTEPAYQLRSTGLSYRGEGHDVCSRARFSDADWRRGRAGHAQDAKLTDEAAVAVFVVETVENAQPAEAAGPTVRFFNRKKKEKKEGLLTDVLQYSVVCIGDTNLLLDRQTTTAKDCNQAGQALDAALLWLGGKRIAKRCEANDAVGIEEALVPWKKDTLWPSLCVCPSTPSLPSASLMYRGPEKTSTFENAHIGMTFNRLKINDESESGNQPMRRTSGRCYNTQHVIPRLPTHRQLWNKRHTDTDLLSTETGVRRYDPSHTGAWLSRHSDARR